MRVPIRRHAEQVYPFVRARIQVGQTIHLEMDWPDIDVWKHGGGDRYSGPLLDFYAIANHTATRAAKNMFGSQGFGHQVGHAVVGIFIMGRDESDRQVQVRVSNGTLYSHTALGDGVFQNRLLRKR